VRIRLHNIGPIKDADVDLAPLTVLVGPNGSGKTIFSSVAYAAGTAARLALRSASIPLARRARAVQTATEEEIAALVVDRWLDAFRAGFERELRRCCAPDLSALGRELRAGGWAAPRITIFPGAGRATAGQSWALVFRVDADRLVLERSHKEFVAPRIPGGQGELWDDPLRGDRRIRTALQAGLPSRTLYFPASRAGFMQTFSTFTALVVGALGGGYFEDATLGTIPGTTSDFLRFIAQLQPGRLSRLDDDVRTVIECFEEELLRGKVTLGDTGATPDVTYRPVGFRRSYPIERAATSIAEVSPLVLYLRHAASRGDTLFIDEPEAHLHPGNQITLARALMKMSDVVRHVVLATHSEFLVSELSNQMMLRSDDSSISVRARTQHLKVFQFEASTPKEGVLVEQLKFDARAGFDVGQFSAVAEETVERAIDIHERVTHNGA
jgi:predicted ATPase